MTWEAVLALSFGGPTAIGGVIWMIRKMFVAWTRDNVTVANNDATASVVAMLQTQLATANQENQDLRRTVDELREEIRKLRDEVHELTRALRVQALPPIPDGGYKD